jgi:pimeloyl-ACP methyl ester carboxylesterase
MPFAHINGQRIFFTDTGGHGPTIVFSHGLLMDSEMFAPQVAALSDRYRSITWDERGHGKTAGETLAPFSYYDSADDLVALLDHLGIQQAVLAGMSQGGYLSLRCALTHPARVRALILIDTQAGGEDPAKMAGYQQLVDDWTANGLSDAVAGIIEGIILGQGWPGAAQWKTKWKTWSPANLIGCIQTLASRDDISARVGDITIPALVIHGESDVAIPMAAAQALAGSMANASLVRIPGAGHAANLTHPEPTNAAIEDFLAWIGQEA